MTTARRRLCRAAAAACTVLATLAPLALSTGTAFALPENALAGDPALSDYSAPQSDDKVTVTPIDFAVRNQLEPGSHYTLRGFLYEPKGRGHSRTITRSSSVTTRPATASCSPRTPTRSWSRHCTRW